MPRQAAIYIAICLSVLLSAATVKAAGKTTLGITTSPSGAEVFLVDNEGETSLGFTPINKIRVPQGTITLRIELEGYEELLEPVDVGKRAQNLVFNLVRIVKPGHLSISATPPFKGARLKVNGKILGKLPQELSLKPGRHQAVVYLKGHKKWIRWLDVAEGQKLVFEVSLEALESKKGAMMVASSPSGGMVFLNQVKKGKTPLAMDELPADNYFVEVRKEGYMLWKKAIRVDAGKRAIVDAILQVEASPQAMLKVNVDIANAEIYLDGRLVGMSPSITLEVEPGDHKVEIRPKTGSANRAPKSKSLRVASGKTLEVTFQYNAAAMPGGNAEAAKKDPSSAEQAKQPPPAEAPAQDASSTTQPDAGDAGSSKPAMQAKKPSAEDGVALEMRTMASSALVVKPAEGALALHFGYPYFAGFRASVGLIDNLEISLGFRSIAHIMNEFEVSGKMELLRVDSFALGASAGLGFGLGADERNSFLLNVRGLASLLLGQEASLTAHLGLHFFSDRNGPEDNPVYEERTNVLQLLLGLTLELGISEDWTFSLMFEGDPIGGSSCGDAGRCIYQEDFLEDAKMYGGIGFTRRF